MSKYYYHGVRNGLVLDKVISIFRDQEIKCKKLMGSYYGGYNGDSFVSVCKKEELLQYKPLAPNAFFSFVQDRFCFIISDTIDVIKPHIIADASLWDQDVLEDYMKARPNERFSDMFDEYQVANFIPLSKVIGIGIPVAYLDKQKVENYNELKKKVDNIISLAHSLNLDIVDSSQKNFVEDYENAKELGKSIELKLNI